MIGLLQRNTGINIQTSVAAELSETLNETRLDNTCLAMKTIIVSTWNTHFSI